jgi:hypothetical protein
MLLAPVISRYKYAELGNRLSLSNFRLYGPFNGSNLGLRDIHCQPSLGNKAELCPLVTKVTLTVIR